MYKIVGLFGFFLILACSYSEPQTPSNPRFNHSMLFVTDSEVSRAFYEEAFGMQFYKHLDEMVIFNEESENDTVAINITLMRMPGYKFNYEFAQSPVAGDSTLQSPHYQHVGIEVDDIDTSIEIALNAGAELAIPKRHLKAGDIEAKTVFFYGPDGELIELMEILEGDF
ncbi:MAG: VOC family protein [Balneolaceae bacterium]|nr:VOC family protein [Balneolaceae bacterium]MBO6545355.1 VOC family protein [Balneolaceae bacterium]MBO6646751.1 VOC family protein [Balneolaceae bacterium]